MPVTKLRVLTALECPAAHAVSNVGHQNESKEKAERKVGFPFFYDAVKEHNVEPDVGNNGPHSSNGKNSCVLHLLDASWRACVITLLLRPSIITLVHSID